CRSRPPRRRPAGRDARRRHVRGAGAGPAPARAGPSPDVRAHRADDRRERRPNARRAPGRAQRAPRHRRRRGGPSGGGGREGRALHPRLPLRGARRAIRGGPARPPGPPREPLGGGADPMSPGARRAPTAGRRRPPMTGAQYLRGPAREAAVWSGGVGLLTVQVARNLALPPKYLWLVAREIDTIGIRSLVVALTAALFTGMVLALQSAVNMARFGAENYVGPVVALSILRELGPVLTAILVGGKIA